MTHCSCEIMFAPYTKISWLTAAPNEPGLTSYFQENSTTVPLCNPDANADELLPSCVEKLSDWVPINSYYFQLSIFTDFSITNDGFVLSWRCATHENSDFNDNCTTKNWLYANVYLTENKERLFVLSLVEQPIF